jgi:hypothetical protein
MTRAAVVRTTLVKQTDLLREADLEIDKKLEIESVRTRFGMTNTEEERETGVRYGRTRKDHLFELSAETE